MKALNKKVRALIWVLIATIALISLYLVVILGIWFWYSGKVMPGVTIAGQKFRAKTDAEIIKALEEDSSEYLKNEPALLEYEIVYDLDETLEEAKNAIKNPFQIGQKKDVPLRFTYNQVKFVSQLAGVEKKQNKAVANPVIKSTNGELSVLPGTVGQRVMYGENTAEFMESVGGLKVGYTIRTSQVEPAYSEDELTENLASAKELSNRKITLKYQTQVYPVDSAELATWVSLKSKSMPAGALFEDEFLSVLSANSKSGGYYNIDKIEDYLSILSKKIDREPVNATLSMKDGKVSVFVLSQSGLSVDIVGSTQNIIEVLESEATQSQIVVAETEPEITQNSLASLGIVELVAEGRSNFAGSPSNRRHNIRVGAEKFNGIIIKPGETFSFTQNLGPVDASTGYLPELVIKKNETIPEFGGGLCQVSSTAFRAALNAGLPITARKQHAYPVTYYKPFGTDATIYIPNPDLKFTNDTGHHILIQTRISGNYLYFDFYGTKKTSTVKFAGNKEGTGAVTRIEDVKPYIYDNGVRGSGSFTAVFWLFVYDAEGKLIKTDDFVSKYDSPDKYPH